MGRVASTAALLAGLLLGGCASFHETLYEVGVAVQRARAGLTLGAFTVGDETYAFLERHGPGDTVVLVHGFASEKDVWYRFVRGLPKRYRVLAVDLPGHGDNPRHVERSYGVDTLVAGLAAAVDRLAPGRLHLVGTSLGGLLAVRYAVASPERVTTLALLDPAGVTPGPDSELVQALERGENPLIVTSREAFDRMIELVFSEPPFMPWPVRDVISHRLAVRAPFSSKLWDDFMASYSEVTPLLPRVLAPTLLVWGAEDRVLPISAAQRFSAGLPDVEVAVLAGCGHAPMIECHAAAAATYVAFLESRAEDARAGEGSRW